MRAESEAPWARAKCELAISKAELATSLASKAGVTILYEHRIYYVVRTIPAAQSPRRLVCEARLDLCERLVFGLRERVREVVLALRSARPSRGLCFALESCAIAGWRLDTVEHCTN